MKTLVLTNRKGGVGKSTLATHAAWYFAETKRVLLIETDSQRNASNTLRETVARDVALSRLLTQPVDVPVLNEPGIVTIAADDEVNNLAHQEQSLKAFVDHIKTAADRFDLCIIDTSPATNHLNLATLFAATHVLAPIEVKQFSIDGVKTLLQQVMGVKQKYNAELNFLGLLVNAYVPNQPSQKRDLQQLLATFGERYMFDGVIHMRQAYADSASAHLPAWKLDGTAARDAGKEIRGVLEKIDAKLHHASKADQGLMTWQN